MIRLVSLQLPLLQTPPSYCGYAGGPCDQDFSALPTADAVFLYSSSPAGIASTIEGTVRLLRGREPAKDYKTWRDFDVSGQLIFCEICKRIRGAGVVFADVTTLNFNLLFEVGFCIGLAVPVVPIRDSTYERDKRAFEIIGLLDTVGYLDFINSEQLADKVLAAGDPSPIAAPPKKTYLETPLYVLI